MTIPWILDVDVTVKPLYGRQEGAKVGYNPHKPGRPSHTYHSYIMANTRLVVEVAVQPGDQSHAAHSMPGLIGLQQRLPADCQPAFVRGDCEWGNDPVMSELEAMDRIYLFKLKRSKRVKALISQVHGQGEWTWFNPEWELKESRLQLYGWKRARCVVVARRCLPKEPLIGVEYQQGGQRELALIYNWWNLFVRLAIPEKHQEAITSRPLLLSSVGRLTESARQRRMVITSTHRETTTIQRAYERVHAFFSWLKATAPQLTPSECWRLIVRKSMEIFMGTDPPKRLPQPL